MISEATNRKLAGIRVTETKRTNAVSAQKIELANLHLSLDDAKFRKLGEVKAFFKEKYEIIDQVCRDSFK